MEEQDAPFCPKDGGSMFSCNIGTLDLIIQKTINLTRTFVSSGIVNDDQQLIRSKDGWKLGKDKEGSNCYQL
jgi:hypothetical protein